jgi:hypothetical protein
MVGIAEEPPRQLAPSVGIATLDFVIRAGSLYIIVKLVMKLKFNNKIGRSKNPDSIG